MVTQTEGEKCPLCDGLAKSGWEINTRITTVECYRCGRFKITEDGFGALTSENKWQLSAYCRRLPKGSEPPMIARGTIHQFISALPRYTPPEKLDNFLDLMAQMTPALGEYTTFNPDRDYPLLIARNSGEVGFLMNHLSKRGFTEGTHHDISLTMDGWQRLEEIQHAGRLSNRVFVAMWFDKSTDELYDKAISPAIADAGYDPLRIDKYEHVNRIDDEIIAQIRRSRFMVADFTGQRYGVYFEAGMMMGLGRTVIWLCDKKELHEGKLHFDIRQFNFIAHESIEDAKNRLHNRILAIEGEGPGQFNKPE